MDYNARIVASFLLLSIATLLAANNQKGEIQGRIIDFATGQNIEYASVALYNYMDSALVTGTISNAEGFFTITNLPDGSYFLKCTYLGYREETITNIIINNEQKLADIGEVKLNALMENLDEAVVSANKRDIEFHIDKDVINVAQSSNNAGGMAADVLKNHPTIQTSMDGSISLRGSTNFMVLIDGKPSADEGTSILNQIPASGIEKIEVITNPSAKYDANHAAGIINIITRKNELTGFSGIVNASASTAEQYSGDISFRYRSEKINVAVNAGGYHSPIFQDRTSKEQRLVNGQEGFQNFHSNNILLWEGGNLNSTIDFYASARNTLSLFIERSASIFGWSPMKTISESTSADTSYYLLDDYMRNYRNAWHYNLSNLHEFNDKGHQLLFNANLIIVDMWRKNNQFLSRSNKLYELSNLAEEYHLRRDQDILRQQYQIDYALPLFGKGKVETGMVAKLDDRAIQNDIRSRITGTNQEAHNNDEYKSYNNLYALYTTINYTFLKTAVQLGLRMEYADRNTKLTNGTFDKSFRRFDIFPNLNISGTLNNNHKVRTSFGRSVWRPTDLQLNPTVYFRDISGEFSGNAALEPSYTNTLELNYYLPFTDNSISITGFYKFMENNIMSVRYLTPDSIYHNNPENLSGKQQDLGFEISANLNVFTWLSLNPSGNFYNSKIDGSVTNYEINQQGNVWSARMIASVVPFTNTRLQINTYYNSRTLGAQVYMQDIYGLSCSIQQSLLSKKLILSFAANDILQTEKRRFILEGEGFNQQIIDLFPKHPAFSVSLTFKLNNYNRKQRENVENGIGFF